MLSAHSLPYRRSCGGLRTLRRSRTYALAITMVGAASFLLPLLLLPQAARSVRLEAPTPITVDVRILPPPSPVMPVVEVSSVVETEVLTAAISPEVVKPPPSRPEVRPKPAPAKPKPVRAKTLPPQAPVPESATLPSPASSVASVAAMSVPAPAPAAPAATDKNRAVEALVRAIERHKDYPRQARRSGAEGTVSLLIHIGRDGRVVGCSVHKGSGQAVLDGATRRLGDRLEGLDTGVYGGEFSVLVPVHYSLS